MFVWKASEMRMSSEPQRNASFWRTTPSGMESRSRCRIVPGNGAAKATSAALRPVFRKCVTKKLSPASFRLAASSRPSMMDGLSLRVESPVSSSMDSWM